jgi:hypothetical protein
MRSAVAVALGIALAGCSHPARIELQLRVPPGDAPLAVADSVSLFVRDATGALAAYGRAPAGAADLTVDPVPPGSGYTVELDASFGPDVVARGRSCPFDVTQNAPPKVPVWFSRVGQFSPTGAPRVARDDASMFALGGGAVLAGGAQAGMPLTSSERYDPTAGGFVDGPALANPRTGALAVDAGGGIVLIAGGGNAAAVGVEAFSLARSLPEPSGFPPQLTHSAGVRLGDGRVLIAGGSDATGAAVNSAWILSNDGAALQSVGALVAARTRHTITLASGDRFAVAFAIGGVGAGGPIAGVEIFDPPTDTFAPAAAQLQTARADHTTTLLPTGALLVVGGVDVNGAAVSASELVDPVTRAVRPAGPLRTARSRHAATLLPSGRVLITGGLDDNGNPTATAELFDPALGPEGDFVPTAPLGRPRAGHTLVPLCDGTFLVVGGDASAEVYNPL